MNFIFLALFVSTAFAANFTDLSHELRNRIIYGSDLKPIDRIHAVLALNNSRKNKEIDGIRNFIKEFTHVCRIDVSDELGRLDKLPVIKIDLNDVTSQYWNCTEFKMKNIGFLTPIRSIFIESSRIDSPYALSNWVTVKRLLPQAASISESFKRGLRGLKVDCSILEFAQTNSRAWLLQDLLALINLFPNLARMPFENCEDAEYDTKESIIESIRNKTRFKYLSFMPDRIETQWFLKKDRPSLSHFKHLETVVVGLPETDHDILEKLLAELSKVRRDFLLGINGFDYTHSMKHLAPFLGLEHVRSLEIGLLPVSEHSHKALREFSNVLETRSVGIKSFKGGSLFRDRPQTHDRSITQVTASYMIRMLAEHVKRFQSLRQIHLSISPYLTVNTRTCLETIVASPTLESLKLGEQLSKNRFSDSAFALRGDKNATSFWIAIFNGALRRPNTTRPLELSLIIGSAAGIFFSDFVAALNSVNETTRIPIQFKVEPLVQLNPALYAPLYKHLSKLNSTRIGTKLLQVHKGMRPIQQKKPKKERWSIKDQVSESEYYIDG